MQSSHPVLTSSDMERMLEALCVDLGICLSEPARVELLSNPRDDVTVFADAVLLADGLDPRTADRVLHQQVCEIIRVTIARAAARPSSMDLFVLDALANDIQGFAGILRLLNHPDIGWAMELGRDFQPTDLVPSLLRLIRDGSVQAFRVSDSGSELHEVGERVVPAAPLAELWYGMTGRGRVRHTAWVSYESATGAGSADAGGA